jgi:hypothetical protein
MVMRGHEVELNARPDCQICNERPAAYDGKTTMGPWAFMCDTCWNLHGVGVTGVGYAQRIVLRADKAYEEMVRIIGQGFHPDTRDYDRLPTGWTQDRMDATIQAAQDYGVDIYAVALDIINAQEAK